MKHFIVIILLLAMSTLLYCEQSFIYKQTTGDEIKTYIINVKSADKGNIINTEGRTIWIDENSATYKFEYNNPEKKISFIAERKGNVIHIKGNKMGKEIETDVKINDNPWYQSWEFCFKNFVISEDKRISFWSVDEAAFKAIKFDLKKEDKELIIDGAKIDAQYIKMTMPGFFALFWHANFWYSLRDSRMIYYSAVEGGPGTPETIKVLIDKTGDR